MSEWMWPVLSRIDPVTIRKSNQMMKIKKFLADRTTGAGNFAGLQASKLEGF